MPHALDQLRSDADHQTWPVDADEREFWNAPLREAIRAGTMTPLPLTRADEAGRPRPDLFGACHLCGNQTRETKDGLQFCLACEVPRR